LFQNAEELHTSSENVTKVQIYRKACKKFELIWSVAIIWDVTPCTEVWSNILIDFQGKIMSRAWRNGADIDRGPDKDNVGVLK
jgi:hypothetical protein